MPAVLDPRDARPLTSREISKILLGIIAGVLTHDPEAHKEVELALKQAEPGAVIALKRANWIVAFKATVSGLRGWCDERDVKTALVWLSENVGKIFPSGAGPIPSMN